MTDADNKKLTVLSALIGVLLVAVLVQSVVIYHLHTRICQPTVKHEQRQIAVVRQNSPGGTNVLPQQLDPFAAAIDPFGRDQPNGNPFQEMQAMQDRINQLFGSAFNRFQLSEDIGGQLGNLVFTPDIDIEDKGDRFLVTVDLPGTEDSRVDVKVQGQTLTISGSTQSETTEKSKGHQLRQERRSGRFERTVTLPSPVKANQMTTTNKKGVLFIEIPKAEK